MVKNFRFDDVYKKKISGILPYDKKERKRVGRDREPEEKKKEKKECLLFVVRSRWIFKLIKKVKIDFILKTQRLLKISWEKASGFKFPACVPDCPD